VLPTGFPSTALARVREGSETPRRRPLLAGDRLLNPVVEGDRRPTLLLLVVVAQAEVTSSGGD